MKKVLIILSVLLGSVTKIQEKEIIIKDIRIFKEIEVLSIEEDMARWLEEHPIIKEEPVIVEEAPPQIEKAPQLESLYDSNYFKVMGVINYDGWKWTWYSQKVLPGNGLNIPGRHVDDMNFIADENGYIVLASCDMPFGTVIRTPFGKWGKIYDVCPISGIVDVYCDY